MRKVWMQLLLALVLVFTLVPPALALEHRNGVGLTIGQSETIQDDLVVSGPSVTIDGTVNGDVFAGGTIVTVNGTINGNLFVAARTVEIKGTVTGSVIFAGNLIAVKGRVERNLVGTGNTIFVDRGGFVGHSWIGFADRQENLGTVGRGMAAAGTTVKVNGQIGKELLAGVHTLDVLPGAMINGPVTYYSENPARIAPDARVGDVVYHSVSQPRHFRPARWFYSPWGIALKFGGFLAAGLVVLALFPGLRDAYPDLVIQRPWQAPLAGFLALIAIPVAAVLALVTIIGAPLGILALVTYPVLIYVGQVLIAWTTGRFLADHVEALQEQSWPVLFVVGALLTTVLMQLPVVGGILGAAAVFYGLGGLYYALIRRGETV